MLKVIKSKTSFDFVSLFKISVPLSVLFVFLGLYFCMTKLRYGVDFKGGAEIQTRFKKKVFLKDLRRMLKREGFKNATVQTIGELKSFEFLVKVGGEEGNLNTITQNVKEAIVSLFRDKGVDIRKIDIVGPKAGKNLRISGLQAMAWALLAIMVYIGLRFDFKYSPGAIAALFHDVIIILGIFAITGSEFTLNIVAALLAVIGYSVNDTVIVYDRVREHEERAPHKELKNHINLAINETLSRTILTSGTTLFVSLAMFFFGGLSIKDFFFAISLGVIIGTYSSIFVAAPITLSMDKLNKKKIVTDSESHA
jgi:preprotein translocase subunit SecF